MSNICKCILISLLVYASGCSFDDNRNVPDKESRVLLDPVAGKDAVASAFAKLTNSVNAATVLSKIANDDRYELYRRQMAICKLFEYSFTNGMTLGSIRKIMSGAKWLHRDGVNLIMHGSVPFHEQMVNGNKIYGISVPEYSHGETACIYLSINGPTMQNDEFYYCLKGHSVNSKYLEYTVTGCAVFITASNRAYGKTMYVSNGKVINVKTENIK